MQKLEKLNHNFNYTHTSLMQKLILTTSVGNQRIKSQLINQNYFD